MSGSYGAACALALAISGYLVFSATLIGGSGESVVRASNAAAAITVDYPLRGSVLPPDMEPPTFLWRDAAEDATQWQIEIEFGDGSKPLRVTSKGKG